MSRLLAGLLLLGGLLAVTPTWAKLPASADEFKQRYEKEGGSAEGAIHLWFEACFVYQKDKAQGAAMLGQIINGESWKSNRFFLDALINKPWIFRSYAKGAAPDNDYKMDPDNFELVYLRHEDKGDTWKQFIKSFGADMPRPVHLKKGKSGLWLFDNYSSLYVDVRKPASQAD